VVHFFDPPWRKAVIPWQNATILLANAKRSEFQFTVNQERLSCKTSGFRASLLRKGNRYDSKYRPDFQTLFTRILASFCSPAQKRAQTIVGIPIILLAILRLVSAHCPRKLLPPISSCAGQACRWTLALQLSKTVCNVLSHLGTRPGVIEC